MRIYSVDIMKYIMACFIASIHIRPLSNISELLSYVTEQVIGRLGVPFFLVTSGFFCMKMIEDNQRKFMKHMKKVVYYYIALSALYIVWEKIQQQQAVGLIGMIKRFFFYGTYYHLWYFPALIFALFFMYITNKYKVFYVYSICAGIMYFLFVFTNTWFGIGIQIFPPLETLEKHFDFTYIRSFLGLAVPFSVAGAVTWKMREKWKNLSEKTIITGLIVSQILYFSESYIVRYYDFVRSTSTSFFLMPSVCLMMIWIFRHPGKNSRYVELLKTSSLLLYGLHPLIFEIYQILLKTMKYAKIKPLVIYIFTLLTVEVIAVLLVERRRKKDA